MDEPRKTSTIHIGAKIYLGHDEYILARTVDPKNKAKFYIQLISMASGNRWSNTVITKKFGENSEMITREEFLKVLEMSEEDFEDAKLQIIYPI